jgi:hypothetical protein
MITYTPGATLIRTIRLYGNVRLRGVRLY